MANIVQAGNLDRDPLKRDFKNFMWKTWMTRFGNAPSPRMYEIGDRLQHGSDRDEILGFRGVAKSNVTVTFGVWKLHCDQKEIILTVSGSGDGAKGNAVLAWDMVNSFDWLAHLKPRANQRHSTYAFDVAGTATEKSESFAAMSLFGQLTGRRASGIIPDDVETPNTSATEGDRSELRTRYAELGGAILKPGGWIKVLGTPQTEQTIYLELATERGYTMYILPALYPLASELAKYGPWLSPAIARELAANAALSGTSTEPTRFSEGDLLARKLEYGATEFDRQFKLYLDAGLANAKPLKLRDIPVVEIPEPTPQDPLKVPGEMIWSPVPSNQWADIQVDALNGDSQVYAPMKIDLWQEPEMKILVVDPSGEGKDETAWAVLTQHLGRVGLVHQDARLEGFSHDTLMAIANDAKIYSVHKIIIEKNYGGGMFGELLRAALLEVTYGCSIEELTAGQVQKEVRVVDTLEPLVTGHRLWIAAAVLRKDFSAGKDYVGIEQAKRRFYRLTYQLTRITKQKGCLAHDDRVDALASGVATFMGALRRQLETAAQDSREAYLKQAADDLIESRRKQGLPLFGLEAPPSRIGQLVKDVGGLIGSPYFRGRKS
jgi:hypothetical protein